MRKELVIHLQSDWSAAKQVTSGYLFSPFHVQVVYLSLIKPVQA